uniref:Glycine N-acyltransferase-like protein n=1 Tax=Plectus sambesii TaxID=2011161 RepID=A0A914XF50_9BILA
MQQKDVLLPDGFEFSKLDAEKDATLVNETWTIATAPDVRNTKSKIVHLPNVAVRRKEDGKLVAFVMLFSFGALNHVYTLPEFRHKGIGTAVQDKMFQTLIAMGICPYWYSAKLMEEVVAVGVAKSEEKMPGRKILRHPDSDEPVIYDCLTFMRR